MLSEIVERKRRDVAARMAAVPLADLEARAAPSDRDFAAALAAPGLSLIAEVKRRSPSRGALREHADPGAIAAIYDRAGAAAISVLCDEPYFGGHLDHLAKARAASRIPILAKDFVVDPYQIVEARAHGADSILLMASVLDVQTIESCLAIARRYGMEPLVETHSEKELDDVLTRTSAKIAGINSRDLHTLQIDEEVIYRLAPRARAAGKIVVAESGVSTREQVDRLRGAADAVLIGTTFMTAPRIAEKLAELGWPVIGGFIVRDRIPYAPLVKICGLRDEQTARACAELESPPDFVGLNFVPGGKRMITTALAARLIEILRPTRIRPVAVFRDQDEDTIHRILGEVPSIWLLQFHGRETPAFCNRFTNGYQVLKAFTVDETFRVEQVQAYDCHAYIFDAASPGSGKTFDWSVLEGSRIRRDFLVAGGLHAGNVAEVVARVRPAGVDTASGIETDGVPDPQKIRAFCEAARTHDRARTR